MRRNLNYLFKFITSSQCIMLALPIFLHMYLMYFYDKPNALFLMVNRFTILISSLSLLLIFFRAYSHSKVISFCAVSLSILFYMNAYFNFIEISSITGIYLSLLLFVSIFISFKSLNSIQHIHQIKELKNIPKYDCIEISTISNFEDFYEKLDPYQKDFTRFKFYYKNCYAYGGWIYHDGEKHEFSNVSNYINEQKIDINKLTSDDFKVISMIFIWFFDFFVVF